MQPLTNSRRSISQSLNISIDDILAEDEPMSPIAKGIVIPQLIVSDNVSSQSPQNSLFLESNPPQNDSQSPLNKTTLDTNQFSSSNNPNATLLPQHEGDTDKISSSDNPNATLIPQHEMNTTSRTFPITGFQKTVGYLLILLWIVLVFLFANSVIRAQYFTSLENNHDL